MADDAADASVANDHRVIAQIGNITVRRQRRVLAVLAREKSESSLGRSFTQRAIGWMVANANGFKVIDNSAPARIKSRPSARQQAKPNTQARQG